MGKNIFLIIALSAIIFSCEHKAVCKGDCESIDINGKVINGLTNEPVANIALVAEWHRSIGWFNDEWVARIKTKDDGTFKTSVVIDSARFNSDYHLMLMLGESNKYLTDVYNYTATMSDNHETTAFTNLLFTVYPKAPLTIKLNRTKSDSFGTLSVTYYFNDAKRFSAVENGEPGQIRSAVTVFTCPDAFTKIEVSKVKNFQIVTTIDSIKCRRDKENVYTVNY